MNISVRLEGGIGDHLLANRFVAAIRDKYPTAKIHGYSDTENNPRMMDLLTTVFPHHYDSFELIPYRKKQDFKIRSNFGEEVYPHLLENMPDEYLEKFKASDKFYDLQIDALKWLDHDYDWLRYYYFFPKPDMSKLKPFGQKDFLLCHLYSRPDSVYGMSQNYVVELLRNLSTFTKVVIISTEEHRQYYSSVEGEKNIEIITPNNPADIFPVAQACSAFLGIDSGIRYIPYHFSKPTFVFSKYCQSYGTVAPSHLIRWLLFSKNVFPAEFSVGIASLIMKNVLKNPASVLFPEALEHVDNVVVNRQKSLTILG